jgi:hypothetical protein
MSNTGWNTGRVMLEPRSLPFGRLIAWDPVRQRKPGIKSMSRPGMAARW